MANTLRIKRRVSGAAGAPSGLKNAELAFNEVDGVLYYGKGADGNGNATTIPAIAGDGAFVSLTGTQTISGAKTFTGTLGLTGATIDGFTTTGGVVIGGNLTVNGTTTTVNSTTVTVDDKNIELGSVTSPTDAGADGGGITLKGTTDKTFNWVDATDAWTSSEHLNLLTGKAYYINGTSVLSNNTLGSGVTASSLTSVGTIATGTWNGTAIGVLYGGTGQTSYTDGQLLIGNTAGGLSKATLTAGTGVTITNGNGTISIASTGTTYTAGDGLDETAGVFSVDLKANGGLVIESTELAVDLGASAITGTLAAGDGGTGQTSYTDGQLLIGNTATGGLAKATITAGSNVTVTNGNGTITIASTDTNTTYTAGDGLDLAGTQFSLDIRSGRGLQITSTELDLDDDLATLAGMQTGAATALALLTATEVGILDGATVTTAELNIIDGSTSATATTLAATDRLVVNDAGTMVQVALSDLVTFFEDGTASGFDLDGGTF
jgi:hypothetical protein